MRTLRRTILLLAVATFAAPSGAAASTSTPPPVVARTIKIIDAKLGPLTFDALASGNPALARRGRLVLLLHGFPENAETYRAILPRIAAAGYYAVAPDQRGYSPGARPVDGSDYTTDHMVTDTLSMATALGAAQFNLVGHDWGALVGWQTAAAAPARLRSLTALSVPHPQALLDAALNLSTGQFGMLLYFPIFATPGIDQLMLSFNGYFMIAQLENMGLPAAAAQQYYDYLKAPGALNAALAWYRSNPIQPNYAVGQIKVPTTYAWGDREFAISRQAALNTANYVSAPYTFVPLAGIDHFIPENATEATTQMILRQLKSTN